MATAEILRDIALSLPQATEEPHFEKTSFRVAKKIFATLTPDGKLGMAKLTPAEQDIFCSFNKDVIYPVPNKWGESGATFINLELIEEARLEAILKCAYKSLAPKALSDMVNLD